MTPHEYRCMTRAEFILKVKGYNVKETKKWEHTRFIAYTTAANVPMGRKKPLPPITKWLKLSTDTEQNLLVDIEDKRNKWLALKQNERKT